MSLFLFPLIAIKLYSESWAGRSKEKRSQVHTYQTIESLEEIKNYLKNPSDTLVVFDVDYVLTHPAESAYQFANFAQNINFIKKLFLSLSPLQRDLFANLMVFDSQGSILVEKKTPDLISELQKKGYKTIALTATLTSSIEKMDLKKNRVDSLKKMGIDFSTSFTESNQIDFTSLIPNRETYPLFFEGILFSNGENQANQKGVVLKEFLKTTQFTPKQIIVIDDRKPNLDSIYDSLKDSGIEIIGLHYKGSFLYPSEIVNADIFEEKWNLLAKKAIEISRTPFQETVY